MAEQKRGVGLGAMQLVMLLAFWPPLFASPFLQGLRHGAFAVAVVRHRAKLHNGERGGEPQAGSAERRRPEGLSDTRSPGSGGNVQP